MSFHSNLFWNPFSNTTIFELYSSVTLQVATSLYVSLRHIKDSQSWSDLDFPFRLYNSLFYSIYTVYSFCVLITTDQALLRIMSNHILKFIIVQTHAFHTNSFHECTNIGTHTHNNNNNNNNNNRQKETIVFMKTIHTVQITQAGDIIPLVRLIKWKRGKYQAPAHLCSVSQCLSGAIQCNRQICF